MVKLKNCQVGTKIGVVVDIDPMSMIVMTMMTMTKRQKGKKTKRCKDKKTKRQKDKKKSKRQKRQKDKKTKKNGLHDSRARGPADPTVLVCIYFFYIVYSLHITSNSSKNNEHPFFCLTATATWMFNVYW